MFRPNNKPMWIIACGLAALSFAPSARAHYLWLKTIDLEGKPHAFLFFGESVTDEAYRLPERIAVAEVWRRTPDGRRAKLAMKPLDTNQRIGLTVPLPDADVPCVIEASRQYGVYQGMLLTYYAKHVHAAAGGQWTAAAASKELKLDIVPSVEGDQLRLAVLWDGKPLPDSKVSVTVGDAKPAEVTTDADGKASLKPDRAGLISVLATARHPATRGEIEGESYTGAMHFASLTFTWRGGSSSTRVAQAGSSSPQAVPPLPEPLASFGAAVNDGWLYVYGGHIGEPHDHSAANLSQHFRRVRLRGGGEDDREWEELPMQMPLQGLPLVAHGGRLYRVGGVNARNATTDDDEDMHSTDEFASYDPATRAWTALAPLPAPRSSHDAVVIGDKLYVVGGWTLAGPGGGKWLDDALVFDFAKPQVEDRPGRTGWQKLPVPFQRRALAAGEWHGKLVAIGGIDEDGAVSEEVNIYDPATATWSEGPKLPRDDLAGFGVSAWNLDGRLYTSGLPGVLYRLSDDGTQWERAVLMKVGRFFHRLLPTGAPNTLMAVGGAAEDGHVADVEMLTIRGRED